MQSSLLRFVKRVEAEKEGEKKRGQNDASGSHDPTTNRSQSATLNKATTGKLQGYARIEKPRAGEPAKRSESVSTSAPTPPKRTKTVLKQATPRRHTSSAARPHPSPVQSCCKETATDSSDSSTPKPSSKKPGKCAYTPLEQQFLRIKASHPGAVLCVECGYRYRFFGEDAEIAARVLKISAYPDHNFTTCSIPTYRLNVHLRRLVASGYKVGVVKQTETAAIRATAGTTSSSRLFTRELSGLYTRSTLIGADVEEPEGAERMEGGGGTEGAFLLCVSELPAKPSKKKDSKTTIGILGVQPSAGNMVFDEFEDRVDCFSELETRLSHLQPVEVLHSTSCSNRLQQVLTDWKVFSGSESNVLRVEALPEGWFEYNSAFTRVTEFYGKIIANASDAAVDTMDTTNAVDASDISESNDTSDTKDASDIMDTGESYEGVDTSDTRDTSDTVESEKNVDTSGAASCSENLANALQSVINLPSTVISCLGALIHYLEPFNLQRVLALTNNLLQFSAGVHCLRLNSQTLRSLEILKNLSDGTEKGSLFRVINHTHTAFGRRLLIKWLLYPLRNVSEIKARQEAVAELALSESLPLKLLKTILHKLPDLEQKLCSAYHKKCSPSEFYHLASTFSRISQQLESFSEMALKDLNSELLLKIIREIPRLLGGAQDLLNCLSEKAAKEADYENLFTNLEHFPDVLREKEAIADVKQRLLDQRRLFRATLSDRSLDYVSVSGDQYLVEVKNRNTNAIPDDWSRISSTKLVTRFRPPYVEDSVKELAQHQDLLLIHAREAWDTFLDKFSGGYGGYKRGVDLLASADCLLSLSQVARMPGYVCPEMVEEEVVEIVGGRHPVIDLLLEGGQFVANDTNLTDSSLRCMIITGPNMGGKSSYIKQVALICILGQIGSFVPATSARLGMLDGVFTRMGAYDNVLLGRSTFMMELVEASEIMKQATSRSLVILDELGRGTSTHDGTAIALATLNFFIEKVKCFTLFVTHYPLISKLEVMYPSIVGNFHMAYIPVEDAEAEFDKVVFLYHLERGQAAASYGLNVASLAGLPSSILQVAHRKSKQLESEVLKTQGQRMSDDSHNIRNTLSDDSYNMHNTVSNSQNMCNTASELLTLLSHSTNTPTSEVLRNFFSKTAVGSS